jgi:hypothetical protein
MTSPVRYVPSNNAEELKIQFLSLCRLLESKEKQIALLQKQYLISSTTVSELEAMREMNEILTNRVESLEEALGNVSKHLSDPNTYK